MRHIVSCKPSGTGASWPGLPARSQTELAADALTRCPAADARALRRLLPKLPILGVTRMTDLTELDRLGIPVVSAIRPGVDRAQITLAQGKGPTLVAAAVSALMEAAERRCAARVGVRRQGSLTQLRDEGRRLFGPEEFGAPEWQTGAVVEWVAGTAFGTGEETWVPAASVYFPYKPPANVMRPLRPSTTGLAAGPTLSHAILHGLLEVIERDAVSRLHAGHPPAAVDLETVDDAGVRALTACFRRANVDLAVLDLSSAAVAPTYLVLSLDEGWVGPPKIVGGQASHLDARVALRRALYEVAQSRLVALQGSREDLERHATRWTPSFYETRAQFELLRCLAEANGVQRVPAPPQIWPTIEGMVRELLDRLAQTGCQQGVWTDLTDPDLGIPVARVFIAGHADLVVRNSASGHAS